MRAARARGRAVAAAVLLFLMVPRVQLAAAQAPGAPTGGEEGFNWKTAALVGVAIVVLAGVAFAVVLCSRRNKAGESASGGLRASDLGVRSGDLSESKHDPDLGWRTQSYSKMPPTSSSYHTRRSSRPPLDRSLGQLERSQTLNNSMKFSRSIRSQGSHLQQTTPKQQQLTTPKQQQLPPTRYTPPMPQMPPPPISTVGSIREHYGYEDSISPDDSISQVCVNRVDPPAALKPHHPPPLNLGAPVVAYGAPGPAHHQPAYPAMLGRGPPPNPMGVMGTRQFRRPSR